MLGTVISKIQQKVGIFKDQWSAKVSHLKSLCSNIIVAGIDRVTHIVVFIKFQFAQIKLNIKPWFAQFTNLVQLIKVGAMTVLHKLGDLGQQLVIIVRKIHQHVLNLVKRDK